MRRFELVEGKSSKFWEIAVEGSSHTVRYGRIGTDGRETTKAFGSPEEAAASAEKLIEQKTKKGYAPVDGGEGAASAPAKAPEKEAPKKAAPKKEAPKAAPAAVTRPSGAGVWTKMDLGGKPLAIASDGRIVVTTNQSWKVIAADGTTLHEVEGDRLVAAAFSADGTRIAVGERGGEKVSVYGADFELIASRRLMTYDVIFSPAGDRVVVTGESSVTLCSADTLGYQAVFKVGGAQSVHFVGDEIVMGGSSKVVAVVDPGPLEESKKKPKAELPEDAWVFPKGGGATFEGSRVLLARASFDRETRAPIDEEPRGTDRIFSRTGHTVAKFENPEMKINQGQLTEFRRVGEARPFAVAGWPERSLDWHVSPDGTRMVVSGGTWHQTEFPDRAEAAVAPEARIVARGLREQETLAAVVYGVRAELSLAQARALAQALAKAKADGWVAIPGGDATSTTGYGSADSMAVAIGVIVADVLGAGQGDSGSPARVQPADVAKAASAWDAPPPAIRALCGDYGVSLDQEPATLLVATGPLALARLSRRGKEDETEDVAVVEITREVKLAAQYD